MIYLAPGRRFAAVTPGHCKGATMLLLILGIVIGGLAGVVAFGLYLAKAFQF